MKKIAIYLVILISGVLIGWYGTTFFLSNFMLHNMYTSETAKAQQNILVLEQLKNGSVEKAKMKIEENLNISKTILEGCMLDACKKTELPHVTKTLKLIQSYEQNQ